MPTARYDTAAIVADIRRKHLEWKYRQDQPREPAGSSEGGRWVGDDAAAPLDGMFATGSDPFAPSGPPPAKPKAINTHGYVPKAEDQETLARMMFAESAQIPDDYDAIGWSIVTGWAHLVSLRPWRAS